MGAERIEGSQPVNPGLSPARWTRMEEIFQMALELDASQRAAFVRANCADDESLEREILALLDSAGGTLAGASDAIRQTARSIVEERSPAPGDFIGAYRLVRKLGEGGMGAVFLAERADGIFRGTVAIKLLRWGVTGRAALAGRMRAEQRILAGLAHENVARMLDAGVDAGGAPWVVMEYVDGLPLDRFVARAHPGTAARFAIFHQICGAVAYAHRRLVIHRDIKPANILVTAEGKVKLLDFGVAKWLEESDSEGDRSLTATGQRPRTPGYASPEQIRGETATTAVDIFALGVTLYDLFAGRHPFRKPGQSQWELEHAICEAEPERPSGSAAAPARLLSRSEQLDLDSIIAKALAKNPAERYGTVEELESDIFRLQSGEPVTAARLTRRYRAGKFIRRHKLAVGLSVTAALAIIAVALGMTALAIRASREQAKSQRIASFLKGMFQNADPNVTAGAKITLRDVLDRASGGISNELNLDPDVAVDLADTIGNAYVHLSEFSRAEAMFQSEWKVVQRTRGQQSLDAAAVLTQIGDVQRTTGRLGEAEKNLQAALKIQAAVLPANDLRLSRTQNNLGLVFQSLGKWAEAEPMFRRAVASCTDEPQRLVFESNLGGILALEAKYEEAESVLRDVTTRRIRRLGESHPQVIRSSQKLGYVLQARGKYAESEALLQQDVATALRVLGSGSVDYWESLFTLSLAQLADGKLAEAGTSVETALDAAAKSGQAGDRLLIYRFQLANVWLAEGKYLDSRPVFEEAAEVFRRAGRSYAPEAVLGLGRVDIALRSYSKAQAELDQAFTSEMKITGEWNPKLAAVLEAQSALKRAQGQTGESRKLLEHARQIDSQVLGDSHPHTIALTRELTAK
jgi:serine/threonine protein kinase/tetratricopeptide (TPR) repeat protein